MLNFPTLKFSVDEKYQEIYPINDTYNDCEVVLCRWCCEPISNCCEDEIYMMAHEICEREAEDD